MELTMIRLIVRIFFFVTLAMAIISASTLLSYRQYNKWFNQGCTVCGKVYGTKSFELISKGNISYHYFCQSHTPGEDYSHSIMGNAILGIAIFFSPLLLLFLIIGFNEEVKLRQFPVLSITSVVSATVLYNLCIHYDIYWELGGLLVVVPVAIGLVVFLAACTENLICKIQGKQTRYNFRKLLE
jgi:hypothetical protein